MQVLAVQDFGFGGLHSVELIEFIGAHRASVDGASVLRKV